jgi:SPP1 family predicted phage head-tail adaptor
MLTGNFRHSIIVQHPEETTGAGGKVMTDWIDIFHFRAELISNEMVEANADNGERETLSLVFRTHYRPGMTTADRLSYGGRPFNITKVIEIEQRRGLEIHCEAVS